MLADAKAKGYRSRGKGRPVEAMLGLTIAGAGAGETLTVDCGGGRELGVPYRRIGQLAAMARSGAANVEYSDVITGHFRRGLTSRRCSLNIWMRVVDSFGMLTFELPDGEQISVPLAPVEALVTKNRSSLA